LELPARKAAQMQPGFKELIEVKGERCRPPAPKRRSVIICSKTFATLETLTSAHAARDWSLRQLGDERAVARHFIAASTTGEAISKFGIDAVNMSDFWGWSND
jgi:glucose-6-phosphate isomerase